MGGVIVKLELGNSSLVFSLAFPSCLPRVFIVSPLAFYPSLAHGSRSPSRPLVRLLFFLVFLLASVPERVLCV